MIWKEVVQKYGKELADKMKKSSYLNSITVTMTKDGKVDIPERDIYLAYKDVTKQKIHPLEWD